MLYYGDIIVAITVVCSLNRTETLFMYDYVLFSIQQKLGIPTYVGIQLCVEGFSIKRINGSGSHITRTETIRSQTPKIARQELSLKGTKFRTRSQAGYRENSEA